MARTNETTSAPDRNVPLSRKELPTVVRRGMDWAPSTENSSAIPARNTRVGKESRKTGRK